MINALSGLNQKTDGESKNILINVRCFWCKKLGYIAKNCQSQPSSSLSNQKAKKDQAGKE